MKRVTIMIDTDRLVFVVDERVVSLATFLKSTEVYEPCDYVEEVCKSRVMGGDSKFRKSMVFGKVVEMNGKLVGKDFMGYLRVLAEYGFKVGKTGIAHIG